MPLAVARGCPASLGQTTCAERIRRQAREALDFVPLASFFSANPATGLSNDHVGSMALTLVSPPPEGRRLGSRNVACASDDDQVGERAGWPLCIGRRMRAPWVGRGDCPGPSRRSRSMHAAPAPRRRRANGCRSSSDLGHRLGRPPRRATRGGTCARTRDGQALGNPLGVRWRRAPVDAASIPIGHQLDSGAQCGGDRPQFGSIPALRRTATQLFRTTPGNRVFAG